MGGSSSIPGPETLSSPLYPGPLHTFTAQTVGAPQNGMAAPKSGSIQNERGRRRDGPGSGTATHGHTKPNNAAGALL